MEWIESTEARAPANETFRQRLQALIQVEESLSKNLKDKVSDTRKKT